MPILQNYYTFFPEIFLIFYSLYYLCVNLSLQKYWTHTRYSEFSLLLLIIGLSLTLLLVLSMEFSYSFKYGLFHNSYITNYFGSIPVLVFMKIFFLLVTISCVFLQRNFLYKFLIPWEYGLLILILTFAGLLIISSHNLWITLLGLELQAISIYGFLGLKHKTLVDIETFLKYFYYSAFSSACLLFGISMLWCVGGSLFFIDIANILESSNVLKLNSMESQILLFGILLIIVGLIFKLTLTPFFFWVGDVYQGGYSYIASYLSIVSKIPTWVLFVKLLYGPFWPFFPKLVVWLQIIGLLSVLIGSCLAFVEFSFKRFWALSSISHMGFILIAVLFGTIEGLYIAIIYFIFYIISSLFIWIFVLNFIKENESNIMIKEFLIRLAGFSLIKKINFFFLILIVLMIISFAGLPPGFGFLTKVFIFYGLYQSGNLILLIVLMFLSLISIGYYLRWIRFCIFDLYLGSRGLRRTQFFDYIQCNTNFSNNQYLLMAVCVCVSLSFSLFFIDIMIFFY